jgi:hypothetical protein
VQDGRIHVELINWPFLPEHRDSLAEHKVGLDFGMSIRALVFRRHRLDSARFPKFHFIL